MAGVLPPLQSVPARAERWLWREIAATFSLAWPVIVAELGWVFMGVVDTIMVGPLGATAIGAVSIGNILFDVLGVCGIGLLLGLDTLVSQSFGARRLDDCDHSLIQGIYIALAFTPLLMMGVEGCLPLLSLAGVNQQVLIEAVPYTRTLNFSVLPLLLYAAVRRYLQGMNIVKPVMFALITANLVNVAGNALLIPHMGVVGAGWATFGSRVYMTGFLIVYAIARQPRVLAHSFHPDFIRIRELLTLGFPAAGQLLLEVGVFGIATVMAGKLAPTSLAAHHVVLNIAGTSFMVPLGISAAGAVRVGNAVGALDPQGARRSGWSAIALGGGFMTCAAVVLLLAPTQILGIFTRDAAILQVALSLVFVAVFFQIFDGLQVVATGVLRGLGDTRTPMLVNLVGHWAVGLPIGYALCFHAGWGAVGIWTGFSVGLILVGSVLVAVWRRKTRDL